MVGRELAFIESGLAPRAVAIVAAACCPQQDLFKSTMSTGSAQFGPGDRLGDFRILRHLGRGGMGFIECATELAVVGSATPDSFGSDEAAFERAADSLRANCAGNTHVPVVKTYGPPLSSPRRSTPPRPTVPREKTSAGRDGAVRELSRRDQ